jgi:hypothetical protein
MTGRAKARPLFDRLTVLSDAVAGAMSRLRDREAEHGQVVAKITAATDAIVEAHAVGDDAEAARLSVERATLEGGVIRDAEERVEGARVALSRAEVELSMFAASNVDGLLAEWQPDAFAAVEAVEAAVAGLEQARSRWLAVQADAASLLRLAGQGTSELPVFPERLETLVRDARRAGGVAVPAPLPSGCAQLQTSAPTGSVARRS